MAFPLGELSKFHLHIYCVPRASVEILKVWSYAQCSAYAAIQIISSNSCTAATPAGDFIVYLVGIVMLKEYFSQPRLSIAGYYGNAITGRPE